MEEQKILRKQLLKNMLLNLATLTIIFSVLGIILYGQVSNSLYQSADEELLNQKNRYGIVKNFLGKEEIPPQREIRNSRADFRMDINPRLIVIMRDEDGNRINEKDLGNISSEVAEKVSFDKNYLEMIYKVSLDGQYQYRAINSKIEQEGEVIYVQILINVDAEESILLSFSRTLILAIISMVVISILISYVLSQYTLKPIIDSWKKQKEFVQNASHELRTPLTIIQAKQELLLEHPESKIMEEAEQIQISLKETKRLSKLVKDLMVLARADKSQNVLKKEKIDLDKTLKEIGIPYEDFAKAQQKIWKWNLQYEKDILLDRNKLHELMVILLDNSIKYTEIGDEIEISTYEREGKCVIEIKDTGIGISEETMKHMFERFYREDKARSRKTGGSGLGLSIADYLTKLQGGSIKAAHNEPKGTVLIVKLPK